MQVHGRIDLSSFVTPLQQECRYFKNATLLNSSNVDVSRHKSIEKRDDYTLECSRNDENVFCNHHFKDPKSSLTINVEGGKNISVNVSGLGFMRGCMNVEDSSVVIEYYEKCDLTICLKHSYLCITSPSRENEAHIVVNAESSSLVRIEGQRLFGNNTSFFKSHDLFTLNNSNIELKNCSFAQNVNNALIVRDHSKLVLDNCSGITRKVIDLKNNSQAIVRGESRPCGKVKIGDTEEKELYGNVDDFATNNCSYCHLISEPVFSN